MKHFNLMLMLLLALVITACGSKNEDPSHQQNENQNPVATEATPHLKDENQSQGRSENTPVASGACSAIDCWESIPNGDWGGAVYIRLWNHTAMTLDDTTLYFGGRVQGDNFGTIEPDGITDYLPIETAYPVVEITVSTDDLRTQTMAQPIDYVGEPVLPPGYYTYRLTLNGTGTLLQVVMMEAVAKVERVGGLCTYGACHLEVTLYDTGTVVAVDGAGQLEVGSVHSPTISRLQAEISTADYIALQAEPFTGTCPTAYDGSEMIYTFYTLLGPQTIASCTYVIQDDLVPVVALFAALDESDLSVLDDGSFEGIFG